MTHIKTNITELVFILDRSGSMAGLVSDTSPAMEPERSRIKTSSVVVLVCVMMVLLCIKKIWSRTFLIL